MHVVVRGGCVILIPSKLSLFDSGLNVLHLSLQSGQLLVQNSQPAMRGNACAMPIALAYVYCDNVHMYSVSLISGAEVHYHCLKICVLYVYCGVLI